MEACNYYGWMVLHYASDRGYVSIVAELVARGADVDARATEGATPLMEASAGGHVAAVRELLRGGADA